MTFVSGGIATFISKQILSVLFLFTISGLFARTYLFVSLNATGLLYLHLHTPPYACVSAIFCCFVASFLAYRVTCHYHHHFTVERTVCLTNSSPSFFHKTMNLTYSFGGLFTWSNPPPPTPNRSHWFNSIVDA